MGAELSSLEVGGEGRRHTGKRAERAAGWRARAGRRGPARTGQRVGAGHSARPLRPRTLLCQPLWVLRLQHLHVQRAGHRRGAGRSARVTDVAAGSGSWRLCAGATAEIGLARAALGGANHPLVSVYFGGGTPTLLPPGDLARLLDVARDLFGLTVNAEITTEANPESVDERSLTALREAGFTRVSLGMQSARPHVLSVLDRQHEPASVGRAVRSARTAGFDNVSLDLIYGAPGESPADWQASLDAALALGPITSVPMPWWSNPGPDCAARCPRRGSRARRR